MLFVSATKIWLFSIFLFRYYFTFVARLILFRWSTFRTHILRAYPHICLVGLWLLDYRLYLCECVFDEWLDCVSVTSIDSSRWSPNTIHHMSELWALHNDTVARHTTLAWNLFLVPPVLWPNNIEFNFFVAYASIATQYLAENYIEIDRRFWCRSF